VLSTMASSAYASWPYQTFKSSPFTPPVLTTTKADNATLSSGYIFLTIGNTSDVGLIDAAPVIMSDSGELIWNGPVSVSTDITNLLVQTLDDQPVLTYWSGAGSNIGRGYGSVKILDTGYNELYTVCPDLVLTTETGTTSGCALDLHESQITAQGTILCTAVNVTQADLTSVGGAVDGWIYDTMFLELDPKTSEILFMWSPHMAGIPLNSSKIPLTVLGTTQGSRALPYEWFHMNSVMKTSDLGYIVNARHTWSVYGLSAQGEVEWTFEGSGGGDFAPLPAGAEFVSSTRQTPRKLF
jgi:hypothetical protein